MTMACATMLSLVNLISESANKIERNCAQRGVDLPTLDDPFTPESELPRLDPDVLEATSLIVTAAAQLIALVRPAPATIVKTVMQYQVSTALGVATSTNTVEILRDAGPQGLHVKDIAAKNHTDPKKLSRVLRLLATESIFKEVSPDVFANNRISSVIDTGKSVSDLLSKPEEKHVDTSGVAAFVGHFSDEGLKTSSYLDDVFHNPNFVHSDSASQTAANLAFKIDGNFFSWLEQPGNSQRLHRFGIAMDGATKFDSPDAIIQGFDWKDLPAGSTVVDVGGGVGSQSLTIAKAFPHVNLVVQDRASVIPNGEQFWNTELPGALQSGKIVFQEHSFFEDQPVKNAAVFFMRMILHDWADSYCIKILRKLRAAAAPDTQLLIIDMLIDYACPDTTVAKDIPGAAKPLPPKPLLANGGHVNLHKYMADLHMMVLLNGQERTLAQLDAILSASGWKLQRVRQVVSMHSHVVAVPVADSA
ncbi:hypothetical protein PLICRDRAFT_699701 [Plicaturopsis crispa FD-325 SS-3]|nr:hypothetical protein PLICRDRAFT_699701 [Plicaturopsis crispa FD-325 SS-3]